VQKLVKSGYSLRMQPSSTATGPGRPPKASNAAIVLAAWELFEEIGFEATSMSAVAERAGVSRRTLFNHFPHKVALLFHSYAEFMTAFAVELHAQPETASVFTRLTNTFAAVACVSEDLEARFPPGPEVAAARFRDDAVAYWKGIWAHEMEVIVLEAYGPEEQVKARIVGAITAQIWTESIALQRQSEQSMRADTALSIVLKELAEILGVDSH
jgi:AcrR family transcriptional regulator